MTYFSYENRQIFTIEASEIFGIYKRDEMSVKNLEIIKKCTRKNILPTNAIEN